MILGQKHIVAALLNESAPLLSDARPEGRPSTAHPLRDQEHSMIESDRELSAMVQELWDNDINRLTPGKDYRISLQVHTHNIGLANWLPETICHR